MQRLTHKCDCLICALFSTKNRMIATIFLHTNDSDPKITFFFTKEWASSTNSDSRAATSVGMVITTEFFLKIKSRNALFLSPFSLLLAKRIFVTRAYFFPFSQNKMIYELHFNYSRDDI